MNPARPASRSLLLAFVAAAGCAAPEQGADTASHPHGGLQDLALDAGRVWRAVPGGAISLGTRAVRDASGVRAFRPGAAWTSGCAPVVPDARCRAGLAWEDGVIEEWFVPEPAGLRQGWRIHDAPDGPLLLEVEVAEGAPRSAGRRDRVHVDLEDGRSLQYRGLAAWGADGASLPATMWAEKDAIVVAVELTGAAFPVTVDPVLTAASTTLVGSRVEGFGQRVVGPGDVDGDGYDDLVVSMPGSSGNDGALRLYAGGGSGVLTTVVDGVSGSRAQRLGLALAAVGDVDGDGSPDVVAGAPGWAGGRAFLFPGTATGFGTSYTLSTLGLTTSARGAVVGGGGDVDGDGLSDVVVGDPTGNSGRGVFTVHLGDASLSGSWYQDVAVQGSAVGDGMGSSVDIAGDVNGDGYADVVAGAPGVGSSTGQAFVYHGSASGLSTTPARTLSGTSVGQQLGDRVAGIGDVNGDGYDDVAVATRFQSASTGRVFIFHGSAAGIGASADTVMAGASAGDEFGSTVEAAGDVNGDGYGDLIITAVSASGGAGEAYLYHGSASGVITTPVNTFTGSGSDALGAHAGAAGDVNGDGYDDVVVSATGAAAGFGEVYVHLGCVDADGDGYCVAGIGVGEDCDDSDASIHPGAVELVGDEIDQDCDGQEECYEDADLDGYHAGGTVTSLDEDCDDPGEGDATSASGDCDDTDASVSPGAAEVPGDLIDQDCDGQEECYTDADADGYHSGASIVSADMDCSDTGEADASVPGGDCDDADASIHPGAAETAGDAVDGDCDGTEECYADADDDGYRVTATVTSADTDCSDSGEALSTAPTGDCDDTDASAYPGAAEVVADGVDQDCDGQEECYEDADDDGYRPGTTTVTSADTDCSDTGEALATEPAGDCDDTDASINPSVAEVPGDEVDQDCDGGEDCYADADADGYRSSATVASVDADCTDSGEAGASTPDGDCDDGDGTIHPGATEGVGDEVDQDCDGEELCYEDADRDGYRTGVTITSGDTDCTDAGEAASTVSTGDCDDLAAAVNPGATEVCNGVDDDCDGITDGPSAADASSWYPDTDGDGFGDASSVVTDCTQPSGTVPDDSDCDDAAAAVYPGAPELCDGLDNDCDTDVDEGAPPDNTWFIDGDGDGYGDPETQVEACLAPEGGVAVGADCDDGAPSTYPGAPEACDGIDQDCDGAITGEVDEDGDGYAPCDGDCWEGDASVNPDGVEAADGVDDDCDGVVDEDTEAADDDGDGFSEREGDCDDTDPTRFPGADETGDGRDEDCDGRVDEGTDAADDDGDGFSEAEGDCDDTTRAVGPSVEERCTEVGQIAVDDDCDGDVDEGCEDGAPQGDPGGCGGCATSGVKGSGVPAGLLVLVGAGVLVRRRRSAPLAGLLSSLLLAGCNDAALYKLEADEDPIPEQPWLDFGVVSIGEDVSLPLTLRNPGRVDITLTRARVTDVEGAEVDPPLARTVLAAEGGEDGAEYTDLTVRFAPETVGTWDGLLVVDLAGAVSERLAVPIYAASAPATLSFAPSVLDVGPVSSSPEYTVSLYNDGAGPVTLTRVVAPPDGWTVSGLTDGLTVAPGTSVPVTVSAETEDRSVTSLVVESASGESWALELRANACDLEPVDVQDLDGDGLSPCGGDCDDADASVRPGVPDVAGDGVDTDCDGVDG